MNNKLFCLLTMFLVFSLTSCGQTTITIPKEFVEASAPKFGSPAWYTLNYSQNEFGVENVNGKLQIKKVKENDRFDYQLPNGLLTAIDHGEFGGTLTYFPSDTTKKSVLIKRGNVKYIFDYRNKIYFIDGIAHGNYSGGALYELDTLGGNFTYRNILDFEDAPEAFAIYKDQLLVATHERFYVVKDLQKELVFNDCFWSSLYPNSIAAFDDAHIFMGMRGGIVKIDLTNRSFKLYRNAK